MDNDVMIWFFGMYVLGTIIGYRWGFKRGAISASENCIDSLISQGIIKTSKDANGETQIHKFDE
jgi:hypothetical protein|tara:strand:+ start:2522 stop:2713 length:192 start_codon:yes stop_codon:yes gene_type:complete